MPLGGEGGGGGGEGVPVLGGGSNVLTGVLLASKLAASSTILNSIDAFVTRSLFESDASSSYLCFASAPSESAVVVVVVEAAVVAIIRSDSHSSPFEDTRKPLGQAHLRVDLAAEVRHLSASGLCCGSAPLLGAVRVGSRHWAPVVASAHSESCKQMSPSPSWRRRRREYSIGEAQVSRTQVRRRR